jgi:predicted GNAT superfamily acetyltransferase
MARESRDEGRDGGATDGETHGTPQPPLVDLRESPPPLRPAVRVLNAAHEVETGPLDAARLDRMLARASLAPATPDGCAFMIAFDADAGHDSVNFHWFADRLPAFVYVDRIVVAPELRGSGIAQRLYGEAFARAFERGCPVVCEVNAIPPNPRSAEFHARLGFAEIGRGRLSGGKVVSYLSWSPAP